MNGTWVAQTRTSIAWESRGPSAINNTPASRIRSARANPTPAPRRSGWAGWRRYVVAPWTFRAWPWSRLDTDPT